MRQIFRLELDENGESDCLDFTQLVDAVTAFKKAQMRKSVFSARIDCYDEDAREKLNTVARFERR